MVQNWQLEINLPRSIFLSSRHPLCPSVQLCSKKNYLCNTAILLISVNFSPDKSFKWFLLLIIIFGVWRIHSEFRNYSNPGFWLFALLSDISFCTDNNWLQFVKTSQATRTEVRQLEIYKWFQNYNKIKCLVQIKILDSVKKKKSSWKILQKALHLFMVWEQKPWASDTKNAF